MAYSPTVLSQYPRRCLAVLPMLCSAYSFFNAARCLGSTILIFDLSGCVIIVHFVLEVVDLFLEVGNGLVALFLVNVRVPLIFHLLLVSAYKDHFLAFTFL